MKKNYVCLLILGTMLTGHSQEKSTNHEVATFFYTNVTKTHLPYNDLQLLSMDAAIADLDGDGDPDIIIANEHRPNILLVNNGKGMYTNESTRIPQVAHDSEDI